MKIAREGRPATVAEQARHARTVFAPAEPRGAGSGVIAIIQRANACAIRLFLPGIGRF